MMCTRPTPSTEYIKANIINTSVVPVLVVRRDVVAEASQCRWSIVASGVPSGERKRMQERKSAMISGTSSEGDPTITGDHSK